MDVLDVTVTEVDIGIASPRFFLIEARSTSKVHSIRVAEHGWCSYLLIVSAI